MAGAEVTVSSADVMMVKQEEGESSGNHKTQVILHLQPILHGVNDDIADTGTTVLAIETHHDDNQAEGEEIEYGYPITCGDSRAVLLFKKFVCPGINVRCVKFNDQLISPKQFVHLAGKATLKDWKRAIRLGGVMLRKMMDSGQIDFYQHDTVCTNTCRSTKFDVLINSTRLPPGSSVQPPPSCLAGDPLGGQLAALPGELVHDAAEVEEPCEDKFSATAEWSPGPAPPANPTKANGHVTKRKRADMPDAMMLNSLCEMFGLLDSVKQALDLRRSQKEENKVHSALYVLDETLEEQRKQGCDKSTVSLKRQRPQRHSPSSSHTQSQHQAGQNMPSPLATCPVIQPLTATGSAPASLAQLTASQREQEVGETGRRERLHRPEEEDASGIHHELATRTVGAREEDPHLGGEEAEETERSRDVDKAAVGRKASKKHKTK
ncbi:glucocorticoid modulatory element-binding protein 1-like isoform X2 [Centroberyx gerrardi]|uniref:glucocorticoid modulatory element-binding protein 1-like isoform X2 n=1 Tax=Centroberyx gerrardi TaxID=166262 RepID=UPI003AAD6C40